MPIRVVKPSEHTRRALTGSSLLLVCCVAFPSFAALGCRDRAPSSPSDSNAPPADTLSDFPTEWRALPVKSTDGITKSRAFGTVENGQVHEIGILTLPQGVHELTA